MPIEANYAIVESSDYTIGETGKKNMPTPMRLDIADNPEPVQSQVIYVYNILNLEHELRQPPAFPYIMIHRCMPGKKFTVTQLPRYVNERYDRIERNEWYYKRVDGRKYATSLLNPAVHPSNPWETQFIKVKGNMDQTGNNMNAYGVFWSLTPPTNLVKLEEEIKLSRTRTTQHMRELVEEGEKLAAAGHLHLITPMQHFAMDYLGLSARWHMALDHMSACPNCGDNIKDGLAYHRNSFNEKCIINWQAAYEAGVVKKDDVPESKRWWMDAPIAIAQDNAVPIEPDVENKDNSDAMFGGDAPKDSTEVKGKAPATKKKPTERK